MDLALINLQRLIGHKTQQTKPNHLPAHYKFFCKFHMVCTCKPPKILWQTSFQAWIPMFDMPPFWIVSKEIFLGDKHNLFNERIPNNAELTLTGRNSGKNIFLSLFFIPFIYWMSLVDKFPYLLTPINKFPYLLTPINKFPYLLTPINKFPYLLTPINKFPYLLTPINKFPYLLTPIKKNSLLYWYPLINSLIYWPLLINSLIYWPQLINPLWMTIVDKFPQFIELF